MRKATKKEIKILKPYWKKANDIRNTYFLQMHALEQEAFAKVGFEVEMFHCDGELVGIGDAYRNIKLILPEQLK